MASRKPHSYASCILSLLLWTTLSESALSLGAGFSRDDPWNPDHIDHLPPEVRNSVLHKCRVRPNATRYFATYLDNSRLSNCTLNTSTARDNRPITMAVFAFMKSLCLRVRGIDSRETTTGGATIARIRGLQQPQRIGDD